MTPVHLARTARPADQAPIVPGSVRALVEVALAGLGALITHQLAYLAVSALSIGVPALSDHRHLSTQWAVVAPVAIGLSLTFVARQIRALGLSDALADTVALPRLAAIVAALFVAQETIEGVFTGHPVSQSITHPATVIGVALAPIVAWLLKRLLIGTAELLARFIAVARAVEIPATPARVPAPVFVRSSRSDGPARSRAPPRRLRP